MENETIKKIIEYFENNEEEFNSAIEELDSYNGYLGDDCYYEMYLLDEFYSGTNPTELLQRAYFGRDDDDWITDERGIKHYREFNPNRKYFYYNGYGNLASSDYKDYSDHLDNYVVQAMNENRNYIYTIEEEDDLRALFDELETEKE